ncbi:MAG: DUF3006 family protein [Thermomicrobiales bacterium]
MNQKSEARLTIDEINTDRDGRKIATLVDTSGATSTIPLSLLPEGSRVNQVILAAFRIDRSLTIERADRIRRLQHRLFDRERESS